MDDLDNIEINLKGYSGCALKMIKNAKMLLVRKYSSDPQYNLRLKKQFIKQKKFNSLGIFAPRIYNFGYENELFYFDMKYIKGQVFTNCLERMSINDIVYYINILLKNISYKTNKSHQDNILNKNKIFNLKINSLKEKNIDSVCYRKCIEKLEKFNWEIVSESDCHGDLTLENIIVSDDNKIYLLDFLDSFYNSWMLDVAKILQDLEVGWSFRKKTMDANLKKNLNAAKDILINNILNMENGGNLLIAIYYLLLLNLLRIYPYTKDKETFYFLDNSIKNLLIKLEEYE